MSNNILYKLALSFIPGVGIHLAKNLIAYVGSIEGVFQEKKQNLTKIKGVGNILATKIAKNDSLNKAEKELEFIQKHNVKTYFYLDDNYPERLRNCVDAPILLYQIGDLDLNHSKMLAIVGTRNATNYGKEFCENLLIKLNERGHNPNIISGLADGIDSYAHKFSLKNNLFTGAVLGHGLKTIYPAINRQLATNISKQGALLTEFSSEMKPERSNFVKRNRIIAGLTDATIVVESGEKGGALITADIANSYNRDVFAVPGRVDNKYSMGCNKLIKTNKAALIEKVEDLEYILGWDTNQNKQKQIQIELFKNLSDIEKLIYKIIDNEIEISIDQISLKASLPMSKVSSKLLELEFAGLIKCLPGKIYKSNNL